MTNEEYEAIQLLIRMAERYANNTDNETVLKVYNNSYQTVRKYCAKCMLNSK